MKNNRYNIILFGKIEGISKNVTNIVKLNI